MANDLHATWSVSTYPSSFTSQNHKRAFPSSRRWTSAKATPSEYKPTAPASKKDPAAPSKGFAAIGSYKTMTRRYELTDQASSWTNGFEVAWYYGWNPILGDVKLRALREMYEA